MRKNTFRTMLASLLAMVMIFSLAIPASRAAADELVGGTAELTVDLPEEELKFQGKAVADFVNDLMALSGSVSLGATPVDFCVYISNQAVALETGLLSQVYGVDLTKAAENLPNSMFAPGSGSMFELDQETMDQMIASAEGIAAGAAAPKVEMTEETAAAAEKLLELLTSDIFGQMELGMKSEDVTLGSRVIPTSAVTVTMNTEALTKLVQDVMAELAENEALKPVVAAAISAAASESDGKLDADHDFADDFMNDLPKATESAVRFLEEHQAACSITLNTDKEDNDLVALSVELTLDGDPLCISYKGGSDPAAAEEVVVEISASGESLLSLVYRVTESSDTVYAMNLIVCEGETEDLNVSFRWEKTSGAFTGVVRADEESTTVAGNMKTDDTTTVIRLETVDGKSMGDTSLTLTKGEQTITIPEYKEVLTLNSEEADALVSEAVMALLTLMS